MNKCSVCGKETKSFLYKIMFSGADFEDIKHSPDFEDIKHSLTPYPLGDYFVCWGCGLKAMGVPAKGDLQFWKDEYIKAAPFIFNDNEKFRFLGYQDGNDVVVRNPNYKEDEHA